MKNSPKILIIILFFMNSSTYSQTNESKFAIKFYEDRGSIGIISSNGCSWSDMFIKKKIFYLNQFGMVHYEQNSEAEQNSTFLFSIKRDNNKVYLKSIKGTRWKELSFDLPNDKTHAVIINNSGIVN